MKILKRYILELCFILSFALPFIKGTNADNGRCFVETYYGFTFLIPNHSYLSQLDVTYKTPDLMSHFLPP
ncbi:hypothetical protein ACLVR6_10240, partial [Streptococcus pneumoniae]